MTVIQNEKQRVGLTHTTSNRNKTEFANGFSAVTYWSRKIQEKNIIATLKTAVGLLCCFTTSIQTSHSKLQKWLLCCRPVVCKKLHLKKTALILYLSNLPNLHSSSDAEKTGMRKEGRLVVWILCLKLTWLLQLRERRYTYVRVCVYLWYMCLKHKQ